MLVRELQIINFRNLQFLRAEFAPGINLLYGVNAQGKTNVLEAIYLLVTGRSFRTTMDREMIPWARGGYEATVVRARVEKRTTEERFLLTFNQSEKHIFVNGHPIPRLGELVGRINAVLFTPADLQLVRGAPGLRRRFLDIELSQISRSYLFNLQRYDLALRQRNALLRQHQHRPNLREELAVWDEQLAEHGSELTIYRARMIAELSANATEAYGRIAESDQPLSLDYQPSLPLEAGLAHDTVHSRLVDALRVAHKLDIRRGTTSVGPHRDDFVFRIGEHDARDFGSQGQQRSCVLALKLAETQLMEKATGEPPILLLDDLMSELDESRKRALLAALNPRLQTFITATEKALVMSLVRPRKTFQVEDGNMSEEIA